MTDELDLLTRYMDPASEAAPADVDTARRRLALAIDDEIRGRTTGSGTKTGTAKGSRERSAFRRSLAPLISVAAAVLVVVAIAVPLAHHPSTSATHSQPGTKPVELPRTWTLAGYISLPGWQVSAGGQALSTSQQFTTQLACPTVTTCYSAGENDASTDDNSESVITVTHDGGATWQRSLNPENGIYFFGITCPTSITCMVAGEVPNTRQPPSLFTTTDGGRRWTSRPMPGDNIDSPLLSCSSTTDCVVLGILLSPNGRTQNKSVLYVTSDGGRHWTTSAVPKGFLPSGQSALQCFPGGRCIAAGTEATGRVLDQAAVMIYSTDGGVTWSSASAPPVSAIAGMMSCVDDQHCVSIEQKDLHSGEQTESGVLVTDDGGQTWSSYRAHELDPADNKKTALNFDSISCSTASDCWTSGLLYESLCQGSCPYAASQGVIMATVNGGRSWSKEPLPTPPTPTLQYVSIYPMSCVTATVCFAVGTLGLTDAASKAGLPMSLSQDVVLVDDGGSIRTRSNTRG